MSNSLLLELSHKGYWPAVAMEYLLERKYSRAIELCQLRLTEHPDILSGRIILARAFFHSGQYEVAEEQFYEMLQIDPDNLVALKYLGDLKFRMGDEITAFSFYARIQQMAPLSGGISSFIYNKPVTETKVLALHRGREEYRSSHEELRRIPFKTETLGDLLLAQGHPRLAAEIFQILAEDTANNRIREKLDRTTELLKNREKKHA
jgi:tetratricopeptide (TPR) repeat protein